jgi:diaminopimelate epimerase
MNLPFWKMHGAGNDFVLVDDRSLHFPCNDAATVRRITAPKFGVGAEGLILIQPCDTADFRMRFFNPDGNEVEMCGNGARCVARLANEIGAAPANMSFQTVAGLISAERIGDDNVRLTMTPPKGWILNGELDLDGQPTPFHFVNSGVPHVVIEVQNLERVDIQRLGALLRYHSRFQPAGTNANFIQITGPDSLRIRTYERGVEAETLACGTGITAAGLIAGALGRVNTPVKITCASGDVLEVSYRPLAGGGAENVTLTGPAVHVFRGEMTL